MESAHNCLTRAGIGPWRGSWAGWSCSPLGGQAGRPAAGKRAVVSPMRGVAPACCLAGACRPAGPIRSAGPSGREAGSGRASGDPFAVPFLAPSVRCEVRAVVPAPSARRGSGAVLPPAVAVSRRLRERGSKGHRGLAVSSCGGTGARGGGGRGGAAGESPCRLPRSSAWAGRAGAGCRGPGAGCRVPDAGCWMRMPRAA